MFLAQIVIIKLLRFECHQLAINNITMIALPPIATHADFLILWTCLNSWLLFFIAIARMLLVEILT